MGMIMLQMGTTYVVKEGDQEVGRWEEEDGKKDIKEIDSEAQGNKNPAPKVPAQAKTQPVSEKEKPATEWLQGKSGYDRAVEMQRRRKEPMAVYFYASWCPYCKAFEKNILRSPMTQRYFSDAIKVKIDAEKNVEIAELYGVQGYPTFFVAVADLAKAQKIRTDTSPEEFIAQCAQANLKKKIIL